MPNFTTIDLSNFGPDFVVHFGGELHEVNVDTFANSLLSISLILKEINRNIDPETLIEIRIEAFGEGSFRTKLKTVGKSISKIINQESIRQIMVQVLSVLIIVKIMDLGNKPNITIKEDAVVIENNDYRVIYPKNVHEFSSQLKNNPTIEDNLSKTFSYLEQDDAVTDFGIGKEIDDEEPDIKIKREDFSLLASPPSIEEKRRIRRNKVTLRVLTAVFEETKRKWRFNWNGLPIFASIKDEDFNRKLKAGDILFSFGDVLEVTLLRNQIKDERLGEYIDESYEIEKVLRHKHASRQSNLFDTP